MTVPPYVSIGGLGLDYAPAESTPTTPFVLKFERVNKQIEFTPAWVNNPEAVDSYLYNKSLLQLEYTFRGSDDDKWNIDQQIRAHVKVDFHDYVHNLHGLVWIESVEPEWDPINNALPWKYKVVVIGMPSELGPLYAPITFDSRYDGSSSVFADHLGNFIIDGLDNSNGESLPWIDYDENGDSIGLDLGMHDVYFTCPEGCRFSRWVASGDVEIIDSGDDTQVAWCTIFLYGSTAPIIYAEYVVDPITVYFVDSYNIDSPEYDRGRGNFDMVYRLPNGTWTTVANNEIPPWDSGSEYPYGFYAINFAPTVPVGAPNPYEFLPLTTFFGTEHGHFEIIGPHQADSTITLVINTSPYTSCVPSDIGKDVYSGSTRIGILQSYRNDLSIKIWVVDTRETFNESNTLILPSGTAVSIQAGSGDGTLYQLCAPSILLYNGTYDQIYDFMSSVQITAAYKNKTGFASVEFHSKNMENPDVDVTGDENVGRMIFEPYGDDEYYIDFVGFKPFAWSLSIGDHTLAFNSSRKVIKWIVAGGITIDDDTAQTATIHVTGAGYICALFVPAIVFDSNIEPQDESGPTILTVDGVEYATLPQKFPLKDYPDGVDYAWADTVSFEGDDYSWASCSGLMTTRTGTTPSGRSGQVYATYNTTPSCPSGEQITNGGFESGWAGWLHGAWALLLGPCDWKPTPHSGNYVVELTNSPSLGYVEQDLINPVPQSCFDGGSLFGFWESQWGPEGSMTTAQFQAIITYTDDTTTTVSFSRTEGRPCGGGYWASWQYYNLLPYVQAGKTVKHIRIQNNSGSANPYIDDVSCYV